MRPIYYLSCFFPSRATDDTMHGFDPSRFGISCKQLPGRFRISISKKYYVQTDYEHVCVRLTWNMDMTQGGSPDAANGTNIRLTSGDGS